jgi:hypothetical protein
MSLAKARRHPGHGVLVSALLSLADALVGGFGGSQGQIELIPGHPLSDQRPHAAPDRSDQGFCH